MPERLEPRPLVLHHDAHLVVAEKPAGLPAVPGRAAHLHDCVASRVQAQFVDALVVHRLDMATSGLMLMARGGETQRALSRAFAERRVEKRYVAVVAGLMADESGEIDLPLAADWPNRPMQRIDREHGKPSLTRWRVLARDLAQGTTRVELEPHTGRSHQLRVHLLAIGHAIVGDALYAPPGVADAAPRLLLHASRLAFTHPGDRRRCVFESAADF